MNRHRVRNDVRSRIAYLAARIMAEDGLEDFGLAKRKAARQVGAPDTRDLPSNEEVEEALRLHQAIYQHDHDDDVRSLRHSAAAIMESLSAHRPRLTGSVLSGTAGPNASINIQLYADDEKVVEMQLIQERIAYRAGQARIYVGDDMRVVPAFMVDRDGTEVELMVLTSDDLRLPVRKTPDGRPMERAKLEAVKRLLDGDG